jgi:hypothetical protein
LGKHAAVIPSSPSKKIIGEKPAKLKIMEEEFPSTTAHDSSIATPTAAGSRMKGNSAKKRLIIPMNKKNKKPKPQREEEDEEDEESSRTASSSRNSMFE